MGEASPKWEETAVPKGVPCSSDDPVTGLLPKLNFLVIDKPRRRSKGASNHC